VSENGESHGIIIGKQTLGGGFFMELILLEMLLAIASAMVVTSTKVIGTLAFYGVMIYLLIRREKKKGSLL
jgi:hypothetical protein